MYLPIWPFLKPKSQMEGGHRWEGGGQKIKDESESTVEKREAKIKGASRSLHWIWLKV